MATENQKKAFDTTLKTIENGEKVVLGKIMIESGYSETSAINPGKNLTNTKGWEELMDKYLPDTLLAKKHKEGLEATSKKPHLVDRDDKGRPVYEYVKEDDFSTRHRYLETAYKIKGKYKEVSPVNINIDATDKIKNGLL